MNRSEFPFLGSDVGLVLDQGLDLHAIVDDIVKRNFVFFGFSTLGPRVQGCFQHFYE